MLFSSTLFLFVFLPLVLIIYYVILFKSRTAQNTFLLLASLLFYAWGEPRFVFIMVASIIGNWIFGLVIEHYRGNRRKSQLTLAIMLLFNLSGLFIFKYLMFTLTTFNTWFGVNLAVPTIVLPIGISFFTFQAISYVIDVYRQDGVVQRNPLHLGLYIALFPQLIAGPIVRYHSIAEQIYNRRESLTLFSQGVSQFIRGLGKKVLLANTMALIADQAFSLEPSELSLTFAWLGAIAYALQIFFDFSGYSDMAIGLGKMFGFHFDRNFNFPYISRSISEFWRRWHISLGTWFRDYVYFPLGGSRVSSKSRLIFNLLIVWLLTGIWHGANWTFLSWGFMYFALITIEKLTGFEKSPAFKRQAFSWLKHVYTLLFVLLGWVLFRSPHMEYALNYIKTMFGAGQAGFHDELATMYTHEYKLILLLALFLSTPIIQVVKARFPGLYTHPMGKIAQSVAELAIFITSISFIIKGSYNPFIYFNF